MSTFIEIDEEWTEAQATRKYSSHKSWHTRYLKKVVDKAFDRVMEEGLNDNLTKCEGEATGRIYGAKEFCEIERTYR